MELEKTLNTHPGPNEDTRPEIDTIWFDLSVRLILFEHISGITRTIERLYYFIKPTGKLDVRYCVVLPTIGFGEVDRSWIEAALMEQTKRRDLPAQNQPGGMLPSNLLENQAKSEAVVEEKPTLKLAANNA